MPAPPGREQLAGTSTPAPSESGGESTAKTETFQFDGCDSGPWDIDDALFGAPAARQPIIESVDRKRRATAYPTVSERPPHQGHCKKPPFAVGWVSIRTKGG